jgi:hypothetical protein
MILTMNAPTDHSYESRASYSPNSRDEDVIEVSGNYVPIENRSNSQIPPTASARRNVVMDVNENDILCGKDKSYDKNKGNKSFHNLILSYAMAYRAAAESKTMKMDITREILSVIKTWFSRFLRPLDSEGRMWEELNEQKARDKISHALRYAITCQNSFSEDTSSRRSSSSSASGSTAKKIKSHSSSAKSRQSKRNQSPLFVPPLEKLTSVSTLVEQVDLSKDSAGAKVLGGQQFQQAPLDEGYETDEENFLGEYFESDLCDENSTTSYSFSALAKFPSLLLGDDDFAKSDSTAKVKVDSDFETKLPNEICFDNSVRSEDLHMLLHEPLDDFDWHNDERSKEFLSSLTDEKVNEEQSF